MTFFGIVVALVVAAALILIVIYNRLVALRQTVKQAWGDVDVQLKQRHDLVPNLVETVKGYASHERDTLDAVIAARNSAVGAGSPGALAQAEGVLSQALGKLFALAEAYPDLKANTNFLKLQDELANVEDKLAAARRFFNNAVAEFNTAQEQFPAALFAKSFGFTPSEFFELTGAERAEKDAPPAIDFTKR